MPAFVNVATIEGSEIFYRKSILILSYRNAYL
jgi:hypothetical protein